MVQIKYFTASQKTPDLNFQDMQIGRGGTKYLAPHSTARKLLWIKANQF